MKKIRLKHGFVVQHKKYGVGTIYNEWGPIVIKHPSGTVDWNQCDGIFDVIFKKPSGVPFLHSCRDIHLTLVAWK